MTTIEKTNDTILHVIGITKAKMRQPPERIFTSISVMRFMTYWNA